jgi:hypothetical protein
LRQFGPGLVLPFFLVAWLIVAAVIALVRRGPRPARPLAGLLPAVVPPLTFAVMVAFFVAVR